MKILFENWRKFIDEACCPDKISGSNVDLRLKPSKIHGKGIFAGEKIAKGTDLGTSHIRKNGMWTIPDLGRWHNHSDNPTCHNTLDGSMESKTYTRNLIASRDIEPGEEITVNYTLQPDLEQPGRWAIKEAFVDDILHTLSNKEKEPQRSAAASRWRENPSSTEADWEKFKQWKAGVEGSDHQKASPEEYELARKQRFAQKSQDNLAYNCENLKKWLKGYEWRSVGTFSCNSLEAATQGTTEGKGSPSKIFKDHKFVKVIGEGGYGVAVLFSNSHIVKIFKSGVYGLEEELKVYSKLLSSQVGGSAKSHDLAVYEYGTIPTYVPNAEMEMTEPIRYIGYAEMGKVIPFESWLPDAFDKDAAYDVGTFFDSDLFNGMQDAAGRSMTRIANDLELEPHHVKPFVHVKGGAEEYANYIINWISNKGLENNSDWVQKYGWAGTQSDHAEKEEWFDMKPIPPALQSGKGAKLLRDFLIAMYDLADSVGDQFIYGSKTRDVHLGNFGISYKTGEVIIFDR